MDTRAILSQPMGAQKLTMIVETEQGVELFRLVIRADMLAKLLSSQAKLMETMVMAPPPRPPVMPALVPQPAPIWQEVERLISVISSHNPDFGGFFDVLRP